ncbi:ankyrin repeat domain-containing protein, chloroplastic-like isoform X3 [Durio zibethinus]|uniref:Ankyrin repeat domain-containing protein, chloroplastic-like isoform X3 n=1 Tax=Durio zibethinus TaxID=66656 RepID=A0A6P5YN71_DURZI|nr:ankyrin repeat domain-containing protein, chloroplastic-like isoform X3 [Durio zibethinus]
MSSPSPLNPSTPKISTLLSLSTPPKPSLPQNLFFPRKLHSVSPSFLSSYIAQNDDVHDDEYVIGDCLVFEDGAFEDPYLQAGSSSDHPNSISGITKTKRKKKKKQSVEIEAENLVPEKWRHVLDEINITKKERRKLAQQLEFGSRVEKKRQGLVPIRNVNLQEYLKYKEDKLAQLNPVVLDNPSSFPVKEEKKDEEGSKEAEMNLPSSSERVAPKNPRCAVYGRGFEDIAEFFNSGNHQPGENKTQGPRKLFTKEEKLILNRRVPDLAVATSGKWLPLHTLAASGEFYLVDALLKHNVDINAVDKNGLTAIHKAIIGKKQAITNYLFRESANPFVRDEDGATLMHYAVNAASTPTIKLLLLYNVDINLQDNDGWTPLHLAVQGRRTDIVKLLLIRGADKMRKNKDGLTPLDLCFYSGRDTRTYELIKLLKQLRRPQSVTALNKNWESVDVGDMDGAETILHYRMLRQGFQEDIKWKSTRSQLPISGAKISSIGQAFLSRFPSPTIFLKISCDGDFLLPVIGSLLLKNLWLHFGEMMMGPDQFQLVKNVVEQLGYEVKMVRITQRVVSTYFAKLYFSKPGENDVISVDAGPSDAIYVANRCKAPIYVNKQIVLADAIRIGYGMGRVRDTKSTYDVSLDSAADGPDLLTEELDLVRNMDLAVKEERYNDAAMLRDKLMKLRNSSHGQ